MRDLKIPAALVLATLTTGAAPPAPKQVVTGPVATYWMSAATQSGFGTGMSGGGKPSMSQMMSMMRGGGAADHSLILQLGSGRTAQGAPQAQHLPPQGLGVGASLPLLTPVAQARQPTEGTPTVPREYQKPKGRMLIFWGCGDHAKPGQPLVIDLAKIGEGQLPTGLAALGKGLSITPMQPPSPARNTTYGEWPNDQTKARVPTTGSLIGDHRITGNYSPDISFALNASQDFLGGLALSTNAIGPAGSAQLGWNALPNAQAYLATAIGGGQDGTIVLWTSSEVQASAFALPDYLGNGDISRLVASGGLMGPGRTSCNVPQEVVQAAPQALAQLAAYGTEANFSYPPRPTDSRQAWNIAWTVKVRYRSQTGGLLGMSMPGMGAMGAQGRDNESQPSAPPPTPGKAIGGAILRGLGGRIPGL